MPLCRYRHPEMKITPIADNHPIRTKLDSAMVYPSSVKELSGDTVVLIWKDTYGIIQVSELADKISKVLQNWSVVSAEPTIGAKGREVHITVEKLA